jgi:hypothetical protein
MLYKENYLKHGMWECGTSIMAVLVLTQLTEFLAKYSIPDLPQPLCLPDPFLFPKLNMILKGRRFQTMEDIIKNATNDLKVIQQTAIEQCFQSWKRWCEWCIAAQRN